jgi:neutral ceramidase
LRSDANESEFTGAITPQPNEEQIACHFPKPILLNTVRRVPMFLSRSFILLPVLTYLFKGYANFPYDWSPSTVDIQIFRVGNLVILVIPGEMTTMAGRRIRYVRRPGFIPRHGSF